MVLFPFQLGKQFFHFGTGSARQVPRPLQNRLFKSGAARQFNRKRAARFAHHQPVHGPELFDIVSHGRIGHAFIAVGEGFQVAIVCGYYANRTRSQEALEDGLCHVASYLRIGTGAHFVDGIERPR